MANRLWIRRAVLVVVIGGFALLGVDAAAADATIPIHAGDYCHCGVQIDPDPNKWP
ncbi:hypothetical protein [Cryptosporangium sp. NPDC048952]|uniref:hypothetical protein n=1 Tax=Cryptosporangium sp. NPDC048952 TaxID=3363961 RepID=UPI00371A966A